jgi:DNA-binding winged helix-turn-helix (wHTH) protein
MKLLHASFGECDVDGKTRLLRRGGEVVHLTHKAFDLLDLLLCRRPSVVEKQEIMESLWPSAFVSDANVSILIAELRSAIGDTPEESRFIRTVHRLGYAFSGPADVVHDGSPERPPRGAFSLIVDGRELALADGENTLGRDKTCQIVLNSATVSRQHSRITVTGGSASIGDLGSKNGTFVGGVRLKKTARLCSGDEIQIGEVRLQFQATQSDRRTTTYTPSRRRAAKRSRT